MIAISSVILHGSFNPKTNFIGVDRCQPITCQLAELAAFHSGNVSQAFQRHFAITEIAHRIRKPRMITVAEFDGRRANLLPVQADGIEMIPEHIVE